MNVNEDNVSVISFLGGSVTLNAALGAEGDGVDSNGYIVVDGGSINVNGIRVPDNALDSEDGITYKSGTVTVDGKELELTKGSQYRELPETDGKMPGGMMPGDFEDFDISEFKEKIAALSDDATINDVLEILGMGGFGGGQRPDGEAPEKPDGNMQQPPKRPEGAPELPVGEAPAMPSAQ